MVYSHGRAGNLPHPTVELTVNYKNLAANPDKSFTAVTWGENSVATLYLAKTEDKKKMAFSNTMYTRTGLN